MTEKSLVNLQDLLAATNIDFTLQPVQAFSMLKLDSVNLTSA